MVYVHRETACKNEARALHPAHLTNLCPRRTVPGDRGRYVGCFVDSFDNRIFLEAMHKLKEDNGPEKCVQLCGEAG